MLQVTLEWKHYCTKMLNSLLGSCSGNNWFYLVYFKWYFTYSLPRYIWPKINLGFCSKFLFWYFKNPTATAISFTCKIFLWSNAWFQEHNSEVKHLYVITKSLWETPGDDTELYDSSVKTEKYSVLEKGSFFLWI